MGKIADRIYFEDETPENVSASPIIFFTSNKYIVSVENVDFEPIWCEAEAFFTYIGLHFLLNLEFAEGVAEKIKKIVKNYFN